MATEVAFLGFGEAASTFLQGWRTSTEVVAGAYDIKTAQGDREAKLQDYQRHDVESCETCEQLMQGKNLVFSLVTADQALDAAEEAAKYIEPGTLYIDGNSCAPQSKRQASALITDAGGRYVDLAIMSPVRADIKNIPLFISGPDADDAITPLFKLGVRARVIEGDVGAASFIKMMRSIMVKGLEALSAECFLASQKAGVLDLVMESLEKSYPAFNWQQQSAYMIERSTKHGGRRAAELGEVKLTIQALGLPDWMAEASANWQQKLGELKVDFASDEQSSAERMEAVLKRLGKES